MAVNSRSDLTVAPYSRQAPPTNSEALAAFLQQELIRLQNTIADLTEAAVTVSDKAPLSPRVGTLRYAVDAWAASLGGEGLYIYKGTGWAKIV